jgi:hypothetical protein
MSCAAPTERVHKNWASQVKLVRKHETQHRLAARPRERLEGGAPELMAALQPLKVERRRAASRGAKGVVALPPAGSEFAGSGLEPRAWAEQEKAASTLLSRSQSAERPSEELRLEE